MAKDFVIPFEEARRRKAANAKARWRDVADSFGGEVWPEVSPSFKVNPGETVFTIGSCFARNIETHLHALGFRVPMMDFTMPPSEWDGEPRAAMNRFHPPAFRQCLAWTAAIRARDGKVGWDDCAPLAYKVGEGPDGEDLWFDLDMARSAPVGRARFIERRQQIYDVFTQAFDADCVMLTPGLIEAWLDRETGLYLYDAPHHKRMLACPERWAFVILDYETCLSAFVESIELLRAVNPAVKLLITTSPVPMIVTFSGQDIRVANTHSKSVLRAVCGAVALTSGVDYFPSYESVTQSAPEGVWKADRVHVSQGFIGKIAGRLLDTYLEGIDKAARRFQSAKTLLADGDFEEAEALARRVLKAVPDHFEARVVLADALLQGTRWREAEAELHGLAAREPERPDLRVRLARAVQGQGRTDQAVALLDEALGLEALTWGDLWTARSVFERAPAADVERLALRAIERFPLRQEAYPVLAGAQVRAGRQAEAIQTLRRAIEFPKPPASLLVQLAELLARSGESAEAAELVRRALILEPKSKPALALQAALSPAAAAE